MGLHGLVQGQLYLFYHELLKSIAASRLIEMISLRSLYRIACISCHSLEELFTSFVSTCSAILWSENFVS
jgi:hypothetical protein